MPYRHAIEKRLKIVNRWESAVILNVGEAVIAANACSKAVFLHPAAEILTGWPFDEVVGRGTLEILGLVQAEPRDSMPDPAECALRQRVVMHLTDDTVVVSGNGREVCVDDCATRVVDRNGGLSGVVVILSDIYRRKAIVERVQAVDTQVRELKVQTARHSSRNEQIEGVITAKSRDLRGPLWAIDGIL